MSLAEEEDTGPRPPARERPEERLLVLIDEQVAADKAQAVRSFARAYLRRLGSDGSEGISAEDLLAEIVALFDFACGRDGEPIAVRAFNPTRETHGYEPAGSVLETNTEDLPFLVDSVRGSSRPAGSRPSACGTRSWPPIAWGTGASARSATLAVPITASR